MSRFTIYNNNIEAVIDTLGAELCKLTKNSQDYLHNANPLYWARTAPYLFPNVGALKNNQTIINDQVYVLPKHGFLRDETFNVLSIENNQIILTAKSNDKTKKIYPFDFDIIIKYEIIDEYLRCMIQIKNKSSSSMPFNFGLHPAFKVPLLDNEQFEDYVIEFNRAENCLVPSVNLSNGLIDEKRIVRCFHNLTLLKLCYFDYQNDAIIITPLNSTMVRLKSMKTNSGIEFSFSHFSSLGIWTPNHVKANFIAIEPWIGYADAIDSDGYFKTKKDLIWLEPNEIFEIKYRMQPLN